MSLMIEATGRYAGAVHFDNRVFSLEARSPGTLLLFHCDLFFLSSRSPFQYCFNRHLLLAATLLERLLLFGGSEATDHHLLQRLSGRNDEPDRKVELSILHIATRSFTQLFGGTPSAFVNGERRNRSTKLGSVLQTPG